VPACASRRRGGMSPAGARTRKAPETRGLEAAMAALVGWGFALGSLPVALGVVGGNVRRTERGGGDLWGVLEVEGEGEEARRASGSPARAPGTARHGMRARPGVGWVGPRRKLGVQEGGLPGQRGARSPGRQPQPRWEETVTGGDAEWFDRCRAWHVHGRSPAGRCFAPRAYRSHVGCRPGAGLMLAMALRVVGSWPTRTQAAASARVRCRRPTSPAGASLNGQR
jgi:hypothetical protein